MKNYRFKRVKWKHQKSGQYYTIVLLSVRESDMVPMISYTPADEDADARTIFTREAEEFLDGRFILTDEYTELGL